jgi:hypothetical protein
MSEQTHYKLNIDNNREILLNIPKGVFAAVHIRVLIRANSRRS